MIDLPQLTPANTDSILIAQSGNISYQKINPSFLTADSFKDGDKIKIHYNSVGLNPLASLEVVSTGFVVEDIVTKSMLDSAIIAFPSISSSAPDNVSINGPISSFVYDDTLDYNTPYRKLYHKEDRTISNYDVLKPTDQKIKVVFTINQHDTVFTHDYTSENIIHNFYPAGVKGLYEVAFDQNNNPIGYNTRTVSVGNRPQKIRDILTMMKPGIKNVIPKLINNSPNDNTKLDFKLEIYNNHDMYFTGFRSKPDFKQKLFPTQGTPILYKKDIAVQLPYPLSFLPDGHVNNPKNLIPIKTGYSIFAFPLMAVPADSKDLNKPVYMYIELVGKEELYSKNIKWDEKEKEC